MTTVKVECDHRFVPKTVRAGFAIGVCPKCQATQEYSVRVNRRSRSPVTTFTPIAK